MEKKKSASPDFQFHRFLAVSPLKEALRRTGESVEEEQLHEELKRKPSLEAPLET